MAPSRPKESATSKQTTTRTTTPKSTGGTSTKPKDNNRVVKASRPETGTASYDAKAVEARRARDAQLADRCAEVYDTQGFELDYEKVKKNQYKMPKSRRRTKAYKEMLERASFERREIENIMGLPQGGLFGIVRDKVQDRVACDLGVPFHKVELPHYKDWKGRGFKADPEEFKLENISEEERQRLQDLATGCALRK